MNIQEILNNLSSLETELQNIKSARVMAEETIGSYQATQKEISKLIDGLSQVGASLISVAKGLRDQDAALSEKVKETVWKIDAELSSVNKAFKESCDKTGGAFNENVSITIEGLRKELTGISGAFAEGNAAFKQNLESLGQLRDSISEANGDVKAVKIATDAFQKNLEDSYNKQDKAVAGINKDCNDIAAKLDQLDERQKSVEERLQKMESFIADDSDIRKSNYGSLQKSSRKMQIYLIIALLLLIFSVAFPFVKEFIHI